jgi:hypothetical protein
VVDEFGSVLVPGIEGTVTANDLDDAFAAMLVAEHRTFTGDTTLPQDRVQDAIAPRRIELDRQRFETIGAELTSLVHGSVEASILQYMIEHGGFAFSSPEELTKAIGDIQALYEGTASPAAAREDYRQIAQQLREDAGAPAALGRILGLDEPPDVPLPQASTVNQFLAGHPNFWPNVRARIAGIKFNSRSARSWGGGVFDLNGDKTVQIASLPATPPDAFARLLVHETGHATFERMLLDEKDMPYELNTDRYPQILARRNDLQGLIDAGQELNPKMQRELASIDEVRQRNGAFWSAMSPDAQAFYQAWQTLRKDGGRHLLGLDLGPEPKGQYLSPANRRQYQAEKFSEFCAETFMQYAMGDLGPHVDMLLIKEGVPPEVKQAWRDARAVLERRATPILTRRL